MTDEKTKPDASTDPQGRLGALVSLRITDETVLKRRAVMFGDGEEGYFMQQHEVFADGQETGVTMLVAGHLGQDDTKRTFAAGGEDFDNPHDALRAAGHDVVCASEREAKARP